MNFTLVFKSSESQIYTYGLVFVPTICWIDSDCNDNILFNSQSIDYKLGYVNKLIKVVDEREKNRMGLGYFESLHEDEKNCAIVVNNIGHGNVKILELLVKDLHSEGFRTSVVYI